MTRNFVSSFATLGLVAALSCGDDPKRQLTDAATPVDGAADARRVDASPDATTAGLVKVTAILFGTILPNATVIFQNADGSEISTKTTDALGQVSETMIPGGIVNVVLESTTLPVGGPSNIVMSFVGVKPGDVLTTGTPFVSTTSTARDISLPPAGSGSDSMTAVSECGSQSSLSNGIGSIFMQDGCTTANFYVTARDIIGTGIGSFYKKDVTIPATGTITIAGETYKPDKTLKIALNNVPSDVVSVSSSLLLGDGKIDFYPFNFLAYAPLPVVANNSGTAQVPDIAAPVLQASTQVRKDTVSSFTQQIEENAAVADYTVDVTAALLPWISALPVLDTSTASVTWTETSGEAPEAIVLQSNYFRVNPKPDPSLSFARIVIAPYRTGTIKIPRLSGAAAQYDFVSSDTPSIRISLVKVGVGYDIVRQAFGPTAGFVDRRILGTQLGRLRRSTAQSQ
jgi:hypothetical protein